MTKIKKIFYAAVFSLFLFFVYYFGWGIFDYLDFRQAAKGVATTPWSDGGKIKLVREPCVLDTPATSPVTCGFSCPQVTSVLGPACVGFIEIVTIGQRGTTFIAAPVSFVYRGGGVHPMPKMDFIAGGSSPVMPWVIGIPSRAASRTQKLVDAANYVIALFK